MMGLAAIALSADASAWVTRPGKRAAASNSRADLRCGFCGILSRWCQVQHPTSSSGGKTEASGRPACPLCILPLHLERPRIDEEAALVWLPEMSQAALNALMRELHLQLRALDEDLGADGVFRSQSAALRPVHLARAVLAERMAPAADRAGTRSPRELGLALLDLSPAAHARRGALLSGLRLLPLGRFFHDGKDIYPRVVDAWRELPQAAAPSTAPEDAARPIGPPAERIA